ncbi:MAG TPA: hypothetical protein VMZ00_04965 [Sporichthya sp.]|nr:hypothetical protein [Sporichthya sp.]
MKFPRTLLGGRIRSSTLALMVSFLAVLTVWIMVRPVPVQVTEEVTYDNGVVTVRKTTRTDGRTEATPTPTPKSTPTPKASPTPAAGSAKPTPATGAPTSKPNPEPTGVGGLLAPPPTPTPQTPFQG